ncbi:MAG: hypothetical protein IIY70_01295 [Oscillospiraceae bacterium]|nr:hypothetical protein [Oscillospiraceae bacterium]
MAQILQYNCPCCGGTIEFDSATQKMKCPYCETSFDPSALMEKDEVLNQQEPDSAHWETPQNQFNSAEVESMGVYTCKSCGGEIISDANTGATHCPFCGNPVVLTGRFSGALKPDYVIPFQLSKEDAKAALKKHMSGKKLLPRLFSKESHLDEIKGLYVPFWLFDADVDAQFNFHATKKRVWRTENREYTETTHFHLQRAGRIGFDNVPVDGSTKMEDAMMESIEPFDMHAAVPFQTAYLSGFYADKYDVDAKQSVERANERIRNSTTEAFSATTGAYSSVSEESRSIHVRNGKAKYALYPVWLLTTNYQGKIYHFAMNGQTGKFVGDMPVDKRLYWKWYAIYAAICTAVSWPLLYFFVL